MASAQQKQENTVAIKMPVIGVFWDIENCAVPHGKSALALVQKIREKLFASKREVEFMCVCDTSKESRDVIQELNYAQVTVVHVHATSKNAADDKLRQSLHRFADAYPPQSTAVLLSGDVNFTSELSDLRYRHHHYVILVHPSSAQDALLSCAHECYSYEELVNDVPYRTQKKTVDGSTELTVSGLPRNRSNRALQHRLEMLSDNCGGKVIKVFGSQALLKFHNSEAATRARKRLQEEDVYGAKIRVDYLDKATSQYWKKQHANIGFHSPRTRPKNRNIANIQRSHSLSPEPQFQYDDGSLADYSKERRNDSCSPYRRKGSLEFRRPSPFGTMFYYGNEAKVDGSFSSHQSFNYNRIHDIPERDDQVSSLSTNQSHFKHDYVDVATMTESTKSSEFSSNRHKKKLRSNVEKSLQSKMKAAHVIIKEKGNGPSNHSQKGTSSNTHLGQKSSEQKLSVKPVNSDKVPTTESGETASGTGPVKDTMQSQASTSEGRIITSSHRRRKKKKVPTATLR